MRPLLDLAAPIVPAEGLGGFRLGANVAEYRDILWAADINYDEWEDVLRSPTKACGSSDWKSIFSLWEADFRLPQIFEWTESEAREQLSFPVKVAALKSGTDLPTPVLPERGEEAVEIGVDLRDGTVFVVRALRGYEGELFGSIHTGMTAAEAMTAEPRFSANWLKDCGGLEAEEFPGVFMVLKRAGEFLLDYEWDLVDDSTVEEIWVFDPDRTDSGRLSM